jgi:type II secretory pathway pseudopilin PulG
VKRRRGEEVRTPIQNPKSKFQNRSEAGQASLISLLVAVVIIGILAWVFLFRHKSDQPTQAQKDATGAIVQTDKKTIPGAAMDQAKGVECQNNLSQLRQAIQMDRDSGGDESGGAPPSLQAIHGIPSEMRVCPASGRPYAYDPRTGRVWCTTPGHERL